MRYLLVPLTALALNLAGVHLASANNNTHHRSSSHSSFGWGFSKKPCNVQQAPELGGSALPSALTLLAGSTLIVLSRRREKSAGPNA